MDTTPTPPSPRFKPMDVAYQPVISSPRVLILTAGLDRKGRGSYETVSEGEGVGGNSDDSLMATAEEWLEWLTRFQDEMLPPKYRAAQERVRTPLVEPKSWAGFRERFSATGIPWL